jgi:hypothetical protein
MGECYEENTQMILNIKKVKLGFEITKYSLSTSLHVKGTSSAKLIR